MDEEILRNVFFEVSKALSSTLDLNKILNLSIDFLENVVHFYSSCFVLRDNSTGEFKSLTTRYISDKKIDNINKYLIPIILKECNKKKAPFVIQKLTEFKLEKKIKSVFILPIIYEEEIIGFIYFDSDEKSAFDNLPLKDFHILTTQIAISIKNAQLYKDVKERVSELSSLYEVSKNLSLTLELDELKELIMNFTRNILQSEFEYLMLMDKSGKLELSTIKGVDVSPLDIKKFMLTNKVAMDKKQYITPNIKKDKLYTQFELKDFVTCHSLISQPLIVHDKVIGVLTVGHKEENFFTQDNARLFSILCSLYASAIENAILYKEKEELSITDGLTGIFNHRYFQERLTNEIKRADRYNTLLSLAMIDIDDFKIINDTYGHSHGDIILKKIATLLKNNFRETDFVARYGGEEFTVILPHTPLYGGYTACERVRKLIENYSFVARHKKHNLTISAGIACYPVNADNKKILIEKTDEALYRAKQLGKNRVSL